AAPDLPAEYVPTETFPYPDASNATVERQDVAGENGRERPGAAAPREPDEHEDGHGEASDAPDNERADGAGAPGAQRHHDGAADPEQHGLPLAHPARARGEPAPQRGRQDTAALPHARGAPRGQHEEEGEEIVALAGSPRTAREVIQHEEKRGGETALRV